MTTTNMILHSVLSLLFLLLCNVKKSVSLTIEEQLLPVVLRSSRNPQCNSQAYDLINSFINGEKWAWQMMDANSKIPSGLLMGNSIDMGNFDECVRINNAGHSNIKGKFCFAGIATILPIPFNFSSLFNDTSVSLQQSIVDSSILNMITKLHQQWRVSKQKMTNRQGGNLGALIDEMFPNVSIPDDIIITTLSLCLPDKCLPTDLDLPDILFAIDNFCVTKDSFKTLDLYDYLTISVFVLIFLLMILSTIYDVRLSNAKKGSIKTILTSFSMYTNGKELIKTTKNPNHLLCLDGIKTLSMFWIIMGHRFNGASETIIVNYNDIEVAKESLYTEYVQAAYYSVDTFMVLSGCLMAYLSLKSMTNLKQQFKSLSNFKRSVKMVLFTLITYLHRYLRLTPAILALYVFTITVLRHIGEGPLYNAYIEIITKPCTENWWSFFLYIENYVHTNQQCLLHLWYVDVDMHVFLLSPFVLWPIVYYPKRMLHFGLPFLTVISCVVVFIIAYVKELHTNSADYFKYFYNTTHTRLAPWIIGIGLGTVLHNNKNTKFHIKKIQNALVWIVVLVTLLLLIFVQHDPTYNYERIKNASWNALSRPLWSLCICWVVWACVKGHGGIINSFLSCNFFQITGRLTFCMYLVHMIIIILNAIEARVPTYFDDMNQIRSFLADAVLTTFMATIWTMAFEMPFRTIEKTLIGKIVTKNSRSQNNSEQQQRQGIKENYIVQ